jgi:photosystem II stability/assembly factor-like uncharacterized protein
MSTDFSILIGTCGWGLWRSTDGGVSYTRPSGMTYTDTVIRGFAVDPHDPKHVLLAAALHSEPYSERIGTTFGLHESLDGGATWAAVETFPREECWRVSFDPVHKGRFYVGTRPARIYRTDDGGTSFTRLPIEIPAECPGIGLTRITSICVHPDDPDRLIASGEIGGVHRSTDGGEHWEHVTSNITAPLPEGAINGERGRLDCHHARIVPGGPDLVLVSTADAVYRSADFGDTWEYVPVTRVFPHQYHRETAIKTDDPNIIFQGVGDDVWGTQGALIRSNDRGRSWEEVKLPDEPNSPVWCFAQHPAIPDNLVASTFLGMIFITRDAGETWTKSQREFTEVRGICCLP